MEWIKKSEMFVPSQELELPKKHHSLADWDFGAGLVYALDNVTFISAPSSIHITASTTAVYCLNRDAACLNLPQGRIETQWRAEAIANARPRVDFRNQGTLGNIDNDNTYYVYFSSTGAEAIKRVASGETTLGSWSHSHANYTWYRERITWWNEAPVLLIRYEYWDGAAWQVVGTDITDSAPDFGSSATNRCGLGGYVTTQSGFFCDDTMIYGPA